MEMTLDTETRTVHAISLQRPHELEFYTGLAYPQENQVRPQVKFLILPELPSAGHAVLRGVAAFVGHLRINSQHFSTVENLSYFIFNGLLPHRFLHSGPLIAAARVAFLCCWPRGE